MSFEIIETNPKLIQRDWGNDSFHLNHFINKESNEIEGLGISNLLRLVVSDLENKNLADFNEVAEEDILKMKEGLNWLLRTDNINNDKRNTNIS